MDASDKNPDWRFATMFVICFLHGALIVVVLRAHPAYKMARASQTLATIFFIIPETRRQAPAPTPQTRSTSGPPAAQRKHQPPAEVSSAQSPPLTDEPASRVRPNVDWFAEAQREGSEFAGRAAQENLPSAPSAPVAPWDPHVSALETTGHGLKLRISGPCYADIDLGQTVYGAESRLQLGCTLGKKPPRGDLFDSLAKHKSEK